MPYMKVKSKDGRMVCVHKKNADGTAGDKMHCYFGNEADSKADKYLAALEQNVPDAAMKGRLTYAERQKLKDSDFVFPDERAFYIMEAGDVQNAVQSWGRYRGTKSFDTFKSRLIALARRKGFASALPKEWRAELGGNSSTDNSKSASKAAASSQGMSLEDRRYLISSAFSELTDPQSPSDSMGIIIPTIEETFPDYIIARMGKGEFYKIGYSIGSDGTVLFDSEDKWTAVQETWSAKLAMKASLKAVGDWELDVLAAPFNKPDSDDQVFGEYTNFMLNQFNNPVIIYHHGVMPGKHALQKTPTIIGKAQGVEVRDDGLHVRVLLDKTLDWARRVWEAAKEGKAVASSDSIAHLARLNVNGKIIMYEKDRPGKIAVWPLAGISLWDHVSGNFNPASRYALALPAMKAIYRDAGLVFPEISGLNINGDYSKAEGDERRARVQEILAKSRFILNRK